MQFDRAKYIPVVEQVTYQGKEIIVLWIPGGADRPIMPCCLSNGKSGKIR